MTARECTIPFDSVAETGDVHDEVVDAQKRLGETFTISTTIVARDSVSRRGYLVANPETLPDAF